MENNNINNLFRYLEDENDGPEFWRPSKTKIMLLFLTIMIISHTLNIVSQILALFLY